MDVITELQWRPTIGDPTVMGWFTVTAYAAGGVLAALSGWAARSGDAAHQGARNNGRLWLAVAVVMAYLCVNKQFDLQSLLTDIGRVTARHQGWYGQRRVFQKWFVAGLLAGAGAFACWFIWRCRAFWNGHRLLAAGSLFLLTFIVVRAVSFHHVDAILGTRLFDFKVNWALELTGILLISVAAAREYVFRRRGR